MRWSENRGSIPIGPKPPFSRLALAGFAVSVAAVAAAGAGSVLDIRSVSRAGLSDLGTNARRIRTFLKTFSDAAMAGPS